MISLRNFLAAFVLCFVARTANAVILYGTDDPTVNTSAPSGALAGSGWQFEGSFGGFLGTPIAANYFVTAKHIGGSVGQTFTFNGANYTTTAVFPDPSSDVQVWQISGTFPAFAPLYSAGAGSEVNLGLVVFGRGTQRGSPVLVGSDAHLGGWLWGTGDGVQRWGTNVVSSIANDPTYGSLLRATFDANVSPNEAHLSVGDSGGGVFIFNSSANQWQLAGINLAVDGPFSTSASGANPFDAAMFDTTGLFAQDDSGNWVAAPNPSAFYATEIAAHTPFIESVVMQLVSAVSRKTQGAAGTFDVNLPVSGAPGIECRSGGANGVYTVVLDFTNNVSVVSASASAGTVSSFEVSGKEVSVNLTGVANAQTITVTLHSVSDGVNTSDVSVPMRVLIGDTTGDGIVNSADVSKTKAQSGAAVTGANFREDVTCDGSINSADVSLVKSKSGTALP
ncbi:MAG: hypothetical protein JO354_04420 [Verrucomicrobia bacterium]|nr:hypothetical protein [Verrucomicrobiota bacterium]